MGSERRELSMDFWKFVFQWLNLYQFVDCLGCKDMDKTICFGISFSGKCLILVSNESSNHTKHEAINYCVCYSS